MKKLNIGILGATGIIGQKFVQLLDNHPYFDVVALTGSERSINTQYSHTVDWFVEGNIPDYAKKLEIIETEVDTLLNKEVDLVFSALPTNKALEIESDLAKAGIVVFSNASTHRMDTSVPILIPEINSSHLDLVKYQGYDEGFIVTNSNCCVSGLVFGLKPLQKFGLKSIYLTTYQSLSGAGRAGIGALDILGNVIPFIKEEEEKIEQETKKILGKLNDDRIECEEFYLNASCARVPVKEGHLLSIVVELEEDQTIETVFHEFSIFSGGLEHFNLPSAPFKPIIVHTSEDHPQPIRDLRHLENRSFVGMPVSIGRLRKKESCINFFLLVDNTIRGAAGTSILNAEYAYATGFLKQKEDRK